MSGRQFLNCIEKILFIMSINQLHYPSKNSSIPDNCLSITRKGRTKRPLNVGVSLYLQGTDSLVNKSWDAEAVMN